MSRRNDCHSISDFTLTIISFHVRHSTQFWDRPERTFGLSPYIALPSDSPFVCWLCSSVFVPLWNSNKSYYVSSFFTRKRMAVEYKKHEDFCYSCSKFQYHSLTYSIFEMTQFKMPCGTYDPLWPISILNTAWSFSSEPPVSLTEISSFSNFVVILDCPGQVSSPLPVNCHVYVWIFFLFSCSTACLVLSEVLLLEYFALEFSLGELMQGYPLLL